MGITASMLAVGGGGGGRPAADLPTVRLPIISTPPFALISTIESVGAGGIGAAETMSMATSEDSSNSSSLLSMYGGAEVALLLESDLELRLESE